MALLTKIKTESGLHVENAYCRVEKIKFTSKESIAFDLACFVNKDITTSFHKFSYLCAYNIDGENPIKQAYLYIKTNKEFSNALDC